jgi:16S rRNA (cytosine967-C5)-methyltransferase
VSAARDAAARVIERVDREQAFAAPVLEAELTRSVQLDARERALATELTYGTLRVRTWLETRIARFAPRGIERLDARVRAHLLVAAYQLFFTRVPAFAAVHEAVEAITGARGKRLGAFANAVLRKVAADAGATTAAEREEAAFASSPLWLRDAVVPNPDGRFDLGQVSPLCILARGAGKPQRLPGWAEGAWSVQEEGSQLAALTLDVREGDVVLDACAGRGNKTAVLARCAGPRGAVDACDALPSKLDRLVSELRRIGLAPRSTLAVDWRIGSGDVTGIYDRVLVDAPCSGVGTLRRRPEIALRREATSLGELAAAQVAIATRAAEHLRPGGTLVYVVCSVLREESEDVVEAVLRARPELEPAPFDRPEARAVAGDAPHFRLLPHVHGTDGYFVARLRSRASTL